MEEKRERKKSEKERKIGKEWGSSIKWTKRKKVGARKRERYKYDAGKADNGRHRGQEKEWELRQAKGEKREKVEKRKKVEEK